MKLLWLAILLQFVYLNAQTDSVLVRGKILDSETKEPLPGADIFNQVTQYKTMTNIEGAFEFYATRGTIILQTNYIGYISRADTLILKNDESNLFLELKPQPYEITDKEGIPTPIKNVLSNSVFVKGKVVDYKTKEPLIGAMVCDQLTQNKTTTNLTGEFEFSATKGTLVLQTNYIGYLPKVDTIVLESDESILFLELHPEPYVEPIGSYPFYRNAQTDSAFIKGRMIDTKTKQPLVGGNVYEITSKLGCATNMNGEFMFYLPKGKHLLAIKYIAYESIWDSISLYENKFDLNYELEPEDYLKPKPRFLPTAVSDSNFNCYQFQLYLNFKQEKMKMVNRLASKYGCIVVNTHAKHSEYEYYRFDKKASSYLKLRNGENWYAEFLGEVKKELEKNK